MAAQPVAYHFVSLWHFDAPQESVWAALVDPASWTSWWPGLESSNHAAEHQADFIWRAPSGYRLHLGTAITHIEANSRLDFTAAGDLIGAGKCELTLGNSVQVTITWDVTTTKPWMNRFAFILRPIFALNHRQLMSSGERGLRRYLSALGV